MLNIRKYALIVFNESYNIIDRYNLDLISDLGGLGYALKVSTIETDVEDYITKIIQQKKNLTFTNHAKGYSAGMSLKSWVEKNINNTVCLEYNNTQTTLFMRGIVINCEETELNEFKRLEQKITFQPLTPFFEKVENDVYIKVASTGKSYPFKYPYSYGLNIVENNEIENTYIKEAPLIVEIFGAIQNPIITLRDENDNVYNEVRFNDVSLLEGQKIIINSLEKKIWFVNGSGEFIDYYYKVDGGFDSYLRAKPLTVSKIGINLQPTDSGYLKAKRLQYKL